MPQILPTLTNGSAMSLKRHGFGGSSMTIEMVPTLATTASGSTGDSKRRDHGHRRKVGSGESRPSSSLHSISTAQTDYLEDKIEIGHPFYKVPTHPLILPQSVLNHELKPQPTLELWDVDGVNAFVIDVMGALPATYNYHEGIHLCRTMFVKKYGLGNYMDSMALFWSMFHKSYAGRDMDPYSASWIRWRHDRRMELEQILCHYPSKKEECTDFLEEYLEFSQITAIDKEGGRKSNMVFYKTYGEKVSRFEVEFLGVEKCCPDCAIVKEREKDRQELHGRNQSATSIGRIRSNSIPHSYLRQSLGSIANSTKYIICARPSIDLHTSSSAGNPEQRKPNVAVTAAELDLENDKPKVTSERARANSIFAEQRIQAIMSNSLENQAEADIGKVRKRPKPLQRSQSVWKDAKVFLHRRGKSGTEITVSSPISVTRPPMIHNLRPINLPAPELQRKRANTASDIVPPQGLTCDNPHPSTIRGISPPIINGTPITTLPQVVQGQLYGQLEDFLVTGATNFLTQQISLIKPATVRFELTRLKAEYRLFDEDKSWLSRACEKMIRKVRLEDKVNDPGIDEDYAKLAMRYIKVINPGGDGKTPSWPEGHQWGLVSGFHLVESNMEGLMFSGPHAYSPRAILRFWRELIQQAYSGRRIRFNDAIVLRHLGIVEMVLELFGASHGVEYIIKKEEIRKYLLERWSMWGIENYREKPTEEERPLSPARFELPPPRTKPLMQLPIKGKFGIRHPEPTWRDKERERTFRQLMGRAKSVTRSKAVNGDNKAAEGDSPEEVEIEVRMEIETPGVVQGVCAEV